MAQIQLDSSDAISQVAKAPKEMLSWSVTNGVTKVRINFSSLSIMQECWRKAEYSLVRNIRSNLESPATLFGSAIHKGLEEFYSGGREERRMPRHYKDELQLISYGNWKDDWNGELLFRTVRAFVTAAEPLSNLPPNNSRSIEAGVWTLRHYFERYITDPFIVMIDEEGPITERKFSMPIYADTTLTIEGFGQIDVVLRNEITGEILPCDHKTTSMLGPQFYQRLNPNFQYSFYSWACNEVLGIKSDAFMVNAIQVQRELKGDRKNPPEFARQITKRTAEDYQELRKAIVHYVDGFLSNETAGYWPMTAPAPCSSYNGCQYLDICSAPKSLRENIIKAKFKENV